MILDRIEQKAEMAHDEYRRRLVELQVRLMGQALEIYRQKRPVCVVFEGWDAAGKGGAIKRLTEHIDPRGYTVIPIKAPVGEEKSHHYLWRFWTKVPKQGKIAIFDRSWYGRVLVERVEGFCAEAQWKRAYREIRQFERQLCDFGTVLLKFWIHITQEEQLRRFKEREKDPIKQWKITDEDWRNRARWGAYLPAVEEMLSQTSTTYAPWQVIGGNNKYRARIDVLSAVSEAIHAATGK